VRDLLLHDVLFEVVRGERPSAGGDHHSALDRIPARIAEGQHLVVDREIREVKRRDPADRVERSLKRDAELCGQLSQVGQGRDRVETADPDVHWVDRPTAKRLHDRVARPPEQKATFDKASMIASHLDRTGVTQEVWRMQHINVQSVTRDPLSAVQLPAQIGKGAFHCGSAGGLDREVRARLIGDWAYPAHSGRNVGRFGIRPPPQERLEETRRLVDFEPDILDPLAGNAHAQRTLTFDAGKADRGKRPLVMARHFADILSRRGSAGGLVGYGSRLLRDHGDLGCRRCVHRHDEYRTV
jgi:hypothetical protein